jgi:alpha-galactosidase
MSVAEYRTHMSLWALLAAPLIAGHDVRAATAETNALLTEPEVIAIDQDSLGRQGKRVTQDGTTEVWARELNGGRFAVGLFNRGEIAADVTMGAGRVGLKGAYRAREVWSRKDLGTVGESVTETVAPHGVALLLLEPQSAEEETGD